MFERLGSWTYRFRFVIVLAWLVASVSMFLFAPSLAGTGSTDQTSFLPANSPSVAAQDAIERAFPGSTSTSSATITLYRAGGLTDADRQFRDEFAAWTLSDRAPAELHVAAVDTATADSRPELESLFRSEDGSFEMMAVDLNVSSAGDDAATVVEQLRDELTATSPAGLEAHVTGAAAIGADYLDAVKQGTDSTTVFTVILVVLVLLAIYRAPLAALIPLLTIGGAFAVGKGVLGLLAAAGWQVGSTLETFVVVLVFGVGTDYAIFLISRYREEVAGGDWHDAARITVRRIGAVITASAGTVIVGMLAMGVGSFQMISAMGIGLAIAVAVTLFAGLTLTPALLSIFGHYLFWPLHTRARDDGEPHGFYASLASIVSKRPGLVAAGLLIVLLVPALYVPNVNTNFDMLTDLPKTADSRLGYEAIRDNLGEDKLVQSTALIDTGNGDVLAPASLARLYGVIEQLHQTDGVATTTSIITPDGDTTVPDGFRPSSTLSEMADSIGSGDSASGDASALATSDAEDGLNQALDYVNGLAVAFPEVAGRSEMRAVQGGLTDALDIVSQAKEQAVLSNQLRTLASSITSPVNAASGGGSDASIMSDYLSELAVAYPDIRPLAAYQAAVTAAADLESEATISAALDLADSLSSLADHFADRPDATFFPTSLSNTDAAQAEKDKALDVFNALPGKLTMLSAVFEARSDNFWIPTTLTGEDGRKLQDAIDAFVSSDRSATRFYVTLADDPYGAGAFATIKDVRTIVADDGARFGAAASGHVGGATAQFTDVQDTLASDFQKVGLITILGVLLVLMVLLRAVVAPLYLVGTVLVSYASTLGISGFIFQGLLGQPGISPYLPLIVFVLLVALGSDYNIFLMHRVREEAETRPIRDAVRIASGRTGAVITSAGLVLAGTFASMVTAPVMILFQAGLAVAIGVLIDTFVVRSILVPAITSLVGDRAWWPHGSSLFGLLGRPVPAAASLAAAPAVAAAPVGRSRTRLAVVIALVVLLPALTVGILTWSFGAAPGNLSSSSAAVVNLDQGATMPGADGSVQELTLGSDLTTALTSGNNPSFKWVETDSTSAADGLASGRYAAVLTIPADFSDSVAAIRSDPSGSAPRATLQVDTDDASSVAVGNVARSVTAAIGTSTAQGITASYVDDVLVKVSSARTALASGSTDADAIAGDGSTLASDAAGTGTTAAEVSSGLRQLADATTTAADGSQQLVDGLNQFADGTGKLASGASDLSDGAHTASDGARRLSNGTADLAGGLKKLAGKTTDLPKQTDQLADGADGVATGTDQIASGASKLADGLDQMASQSKGMGDGAVQLDDGAAALEQGARDLRDGANQTAAGAAQLASGAADLSFGVDAYTNGVDGLAANCLAMGGSDMLCNQLAGISAGSHDLRAGASGVASGAADLSQGVDSLASGMDGIVTGANGVHQGTSELATGLPQLESGIAQSASGADDLAAGAAQVAGGAGQLADGTRQMADGMPALSDGIAQLSDGAGALAKGMDKYAAGMVDLADGTSTLASGARKTASGASELADGASSSSDGMSQLNDAIGSAADGAALVETQVKGLADDGTTLADRATSLASGLDDSAEALPSYDDSTRSRVGDLAADPLTVATTQYSSTSSETAFAPYFLALAAWLGALGAFLVLPALARRDDRSWWLAAGLPYAAAATISTVGAVLTLPVLALLGVSVASPVALLVLVVLSALAFTAVIQLLVALFGMRGWFVGLLLLVLGIAASGLGTDSSAVPAALAAIRPLLPLSYAIDGFRYAILGSSGTPAIDALVLGALAIVGVLATLTVAASRMRYPSEPSRWAASA